MRIAIAILLFLSPVAFARVDTQSSTDADTFCSGPADKEVCFDKNGNVVPTTDNNQSLGTTGLTWSSIYSSGADIDGDVTIRGGLNFTRGAAAYLGTSDNYNLTFQTNGVGNRMVIDTSGNVGIGTSSPGGRLDVVSDSGIIIGSGTATGQSYGVLTWGVLRSDSFDIYGKAGKALGLGANGTVVQTITPSGLVGIGTTSPGTTLDVNGSISLRGANVLCTSGAAQATCNLGNDYASGAVALVSAGTAKLTVSAAGNTTLGGGFTRLVRTLAQIHAITPVNAGEEYLCSNCARAYDVCVATGTAIDQFRVQSGTTGCQ